MFESFKLGLGSFSELASGLSRLAERGVSSIFRLIVSLGRPGSMALLSMGDRGKMGDLVALCWGFFRGV